MKNNIYELPYDGNSLARNPWSSSNDEFIESDKIRGYRFSRGTVLNINNKVIVQGNVCAILTFINLTSIDSEWIVKGYFDRYSVFIESTIKGYFVKEEIKGDTYRYYLEKLDAA